MEKFISVAPVRDDHRISVALAGDDCRISAAPERDGRRISAALVVCSKYKNYQNTLSCERKYILPVYILGYL